MPSVYGISCWYLELLRASLDMVRGNTTCPRWLTKRRRMARTRRSLAAPGAHEMTTSYEQFKTLLDVLDGF